MLRKSNESKKTNTCLICEERIDNKDYYLYLCVPCNFYTPYCFSCNKSLDVLLDAKLFKCFFCKKLCCVARIETFFKNVPLECDFVNSAFQGEARMEIRPNTQDNNRTYRNFLGSNFVPIEPMQVLTNMQGQLQGQGQGQINTSNQIVEDVVSILNSPVNLNNNQSRTEPRIDMSVNEFSSIGFPTSLRKDFKKKTRTELDDQWERFNFLYKPPVKGRLTWRMNVSSKDYPFIYNYENFVFRFNPNPDLTNYSKRRIPFTNNVNFNNNVGIIPIPTYSIPSLPSIGSGNTNITPFLKKSVNSVLSVRQDLLNRPQIDERGSKMNYSLLQSKQSNNNNIGSVRKEFLKPLSTRRPENNSDKENVKRPASTVKTSIFAGYNKEESSVRSKSPVPRVNTRSLNNMNLNMTNTTNDTIRLNQSAVQHSDTPLNLQNSLCPINSISHFRY